jgi:hypothetical protein
VSQQPKWLWRCFLNCPLDWECDPAQPISVRLQWQWMLLPIFHQYKWNSTKKKGSCCWVLVRGAEFQRKLMFVSYGWKKRNKRNLPNRIRPLNLQQVWGRWWGLSKWSFGVNCEREEELRNRNTIEKKKNKAK